MKNTVCYEFKTLDNLIQRKLIKDFKQCQNFFITPVQAQILKYLIENKEVYQRDLDKIFKFRRSTSLGILKTMEKNGLIIRKDLNENSRLKQILITKEGIEKFEIVKTNMINFELSLIKNISREDLDVFFKVIHKIKENIKEEI